MKKMRILIVDDEPSIRSLLLHFLGGEGFDGLTAVNGREGLEMAKKDEPDLIILDLNLPDMHGEEVCHKIRQEPAIAHIPVLIMTGRTTEGLPARVLNGGADDYLAKPFDMEEILARVRALLRRTQRFALKQTVIASGRITIRVEERMILWKGRRLHALAPKEYDLLRILVSHAPRVLDKNMITQEVWGSPFSQVHQRTLDVHMRRIRKKLGPTVASCLRTIPSIGYQWLDDTSLATLPAPSAR